MKILFAAGGTAGHINPALAVASAWKRYDPKAEYLFVAVPGGMEERLVKETGYRTVPLPVGGIPRRISPKTVKALFLAFLSPVKAKKILRDFSPDLVYATGGYLSWPVLVAARRLHIPAFLHEMNAYPGLVTRLTAKKVTKVFLGFSDAASRLSRKAATQTVGIPLRENFGKIPRAVARKKLGIRDGTFLILSFGGSLGADKINGAIVGASRKLAGANYLFFHATGRARYDDMKKYASENLRIFPYIDDMETFMSAADLVISRSGASATAEIATVGLPSVLIPYPLSTGDHQTKNAEAFDARGASVIIRDGDLTDEVIAQTVTHLSEDLNLRCRMSARAHTMSSANTARKVCESIRETLRLP